MRKDDGRIKVSKEQRDDMVARIKGYFLKERDEQIGDLAAGMLLDFFIVELSPAFYNQGVADSYKFMQDKLEDLMLIQK